MMSHIVRSGMFGYISGPVTTTQYRAERTERRYRKRALNSHRPWVFVQDRVMGGGGERGMWTAEASRICATLDEDLAAFRDRPLADATYPYVFLDATYCKARIGRPVVSQAVVVGVAADRKKRSPRLRGR